MNEEFELKGPVIIYLEGGRGKNQGGSKLFQIG